MNKKSKEKLLSVIASAIFVVVVIALDNFGIIDVSKFVYNDNDIIIETDKFDSTKLYNVVRVVDGDTIVVDFNGTNEKVRLIGVDTPESVHPNGTKNTEEGILVSNYTKEKLNGKKVSLEFDVQERDKYGRLLAYVYLDGQMYNKHLLSIGYAKIATYPPNVKYVDEFKELQENARKNKVGLWNEK